MYNYKFVGFIKYFFADNNYHQRVFLPKIINRRLNLLLYNPS
jgi:hypothetical protein